MNISDPDPDGCGRGGRTMKRRKDVEALRLESHNLRRGVFCVRVMTCVALGEGACLVCNWSVRLHVTSQPRNHSSYCV